MNPPAYQHWRIDYDLDGIAWLTLDRADEKTNSLSREVLTELEMIVDLFSRSSPRGLVIQSGKKGSFVVGADVREFEGVSNPALAAESIREVHQLFERIESFKFPVVVTIEGFCLGGGLELALACHYRIVLDVPHTRLGYPEIKLGIYPGFGGSARTVALVGGPKGMELMLSSRMLSARSAKAMGLVDQVVGPHGSLRWAARNAILKMRKSKGPGFINRISNSGPARKVLANIMRKQTASRANPKHYPAPFSLIDAWEECGDSKADMLEQEAQRVGELITTDTSRNLRRVFWLMEGLKATGKKSSFRARRVHVVGAGVMGGDIAAWCVLQGLEVTLQDREMKYIEPALKRADSLFRKKLRTPDLIAGARSRLLADVEGKGVARADVVIEAIFENVDAKRALYSQIEPRLKADALLATNTSAIPLAELSRDLDQPSRLIGLHFFNPVAKMPLVEVVHDPLTSAEEVERGSAFCNQINRFPLAVTSTPGFLVNRVLAPYMQRALSIHQQRGVPKEALDQAAVEFGMPMGPVELADTVGLDVGLSVIRLLGGPNATEEVAVLQSMVDQGKLGKKSGEGFYTWQKGKAVKNVHALQGINLKSLAAELMQPYFDECQACLADQVVESADFLDAGMIFGTGFAPFRGGPLHYLASQNATHPLPPFSSTGPTMDSHQAATESAGESA